MIVLGDDLPCEALFVEIISFKLHCVLILFWWGITVLAVIDGCRLFELFAEL